MTWEQDTIDRVGRQLAKSRKARKLSAQALADLTAELGYPIGRATISEYENGRRKSMTVCELLILAAALNIPPVYLLYGDQLADGEVEVVPGRKKPADHALLWAAGELPGQVEESRSPESQAMGLIRTRAGTDALEQMWAQKGVGGLDAEDARRIMLQRRHNIEQMKSLGMVVNPRRESIYSVRVEFDSGDDQ